MVNLLLQDIILVNLGFHIMVQSLSFHGYSILFLRLKERQIHIGPIDLVWANQPSGETTLYLLLQPVDQYLSKAAF